MEGFSFKSGRTVQVATIIKQDWPIYSVKIRILAQKHFITKVLDRRIKFVCVAMCSFVMSLCSRDVVKYSSGSTYTVPGFWMVKH